MSAMKPTVPAESKVPSAVRARLPSAAPPATSAGPATTGHISGGLVSLCSNSHGARSAGRLR